MEMEIVWKAGLALGAALLVLEYFAIAWRVRRMARDMRRAVELLDRLVELQSSQHLAQRVKVPGIGDVPLGRR